MKQNLGCYISLPLKEILSSKFQQVPKNNFGYFFLMTSSNSQVASSRVKPSHNTLTRGIILFRNYFTSVSNIDAGTSWYVMFSFIWIGSSRITCEESGRYFRSCDTWKTLCKLDKLGGRAT